MVVYLHLAVLLTSHRDQRCRVAGRHQLESDRDLTLSQTLRHCVCSSLITTDVYFVVVVVVFQTTEIGKEL